MIGRRTLEDLEYCIIGKQSWRGTRKMWEQQWYQNYTNYLSKVE